MSVWVTIVEPAGTAIAALIAFIAWKDSRGDKHKADVQEQIARSLEPLALQLVTLTQKLDAYVSGSGVAMESAVEHAVGPLRQDVAVLKSQVEVFWKAVALDAAKILHQPDPARAQMDHLLEALVEDILTPEEELQLRKYLVAVRNWEPGQDAGFPVSPGEQTAAAILLRTMEHVITPRGVKGDRKHGHRE